MTMQRLMEKQGSATAGDAWAAAGDGAGPPVAADARGLGFDDGSQHSSLGRRSGSRRSSPRGGSESRFAESARRRREASSKTRRDVDARTPEATAPPFFESDGQLATVQWHALHGATHGAPSSAAAAIVDGAGPPLRDIAELRSDYDARFSGLHAYGASGMTRLEEMVEAAMAASERAGAAARAEKRARHKSPTGAKAFRPAVRSTRCAALLARSGTLHVTCAVASMTDATLSVSAERAAVLRAVADGDSAFLGLVVADACSEDLPVPDGTARQVLAEYGDFPVYLVNRDLRARPPRGTRLVPRHVTLSGRSNAPFRGRWGGRTLETETSRDRARPSTLDLGD